MERNFTIISFYNQPKKTLLKRKVSLATRCLLFLLCLSQAAFAQDAVISGKLTDEKASPLRFANVALLKAADSVFVAGVLTDSEGRFSLKMPAPGKFILRFSSIGFGEKRTEPFDIAPNAPSKDLGTLTMQELPRNMKDVTVTALRPTITQLADRMVVNVQGTAMAAGATAFDVLSRSPGVFIDQDGNIQLNGKSGVTVMIDGKLTYLSANDLRTMLQGMSAENIKNIEIITNPSSKYDAEGSSGILNINLKKNDRQGMNGSVYGSYNYNGKQHGFSSGGNINYNSGKWTTYMTVDMARRVGGREATFTRVFYGRNETTYFDQVATGNFVVQGPPAVRIGVDYNLTTRHSIGVMTYYVNNKAKSDFLTDTYLGNAPGQPSLYIDANNYSSNRFTNRTTNLHYLGKLDTNGTTFSADFDYVKITNRGESDFLNYYDSLQRQTQTVKDFLYTYTPNGFDIYSGKVDFTRPLPGGKKLELGAKASRVISDNDSRFYFNNNGKIIDPKRTNHFNYREKIYAAYVNYSGKLGKKLSVQAGLRAEHTNSLGNSITKGQVTERSYTNLFPSLFVQQNVSENYGIGYSYTRRIQRPNYGNLNPFRFYRDPYTWIEGNPYLRPQYAHSFSMANTFKKTYILTLSYLMTKDVISELPSLNADSATTIYYTGNVNDGHNLSMTAIVPVRIMKNWDVNNTLIVAYTKFTMEYNKKDIVNDQVFYMLQSNHTIVLPKDFKIELNGLYRGPSVSGLYQIDPWVRVDMAVKKSFLKKKLDLSINATDLFKGQRLIFKTDIEGNINDFDQYFRTRTIGATLRYHFSKGKKVETKNRNNSLEEVNRTN
jgi:hypothetical protein